MLRSKEKTAADKLTKVLRALVKKHGPSVFEDPSKIPLLRQVGEAASAGKIPDPSLRTIKHLGKGVDTRVDLVATKQGRLGAKRTPRVGEHRPGFGYMDAQGATRTITQDTDNLRAAARALGDDSTITVPKVHSERASGGIKDSLSFNRIPTNDAVIDVGRGATRRVSLNDPVIANRMKRDPAFRKKVMAARTTETGKPSAIVDAVDYTGERMPTGKDISNLVSGLDRVKQRTGVFNPDTHLGNVLYREGKKPMVVDWGRVRTGGDLPMSQRAKAMAAETAVAAPAVGRKPWMKSGGSSKLLEDAARHGGWEGKQPSYFGRGRPSGTSSGASFGGFGAPSVSFNVPSAKPPGPHGTKATASPWRRKPNTGEAKQARQAKYEKEVREFKVRQNRKRRAMKSDRAAIDAAFDKRHRFFRLKRTKKDPNVGTNDPQGLGINTRPSVLEHRLEKQLAKGGPRRRYDALYGPGSVAGRRKWSGLAD